jgi:hypothetical protein
MTTAIETQLAALLKKAESGKRKAEENSLLYPLSAFGFPLLMVTTDDGRCNKSGSYYFTSP